MTTRRDAFILGLMSGAAGLTLLKPAAADTACSAEAVAAASALLDQYVEAMNAHETSNFPKFFTESYIQRSGRSPSGWRRR